MAVADINKIDKKIREKYGFNRNAFRLDNVKNAEKDRYDERVVVKN